MSLKTIILAAGQGTRMRSALPKVLHCIAGRPLLQHVIESAQNLDSNSIAVVYGHGGDRVKLSFVDQNLCWFEQAEQLGTGHAVEQALPHVDDNDTVFILYGDVPLLKSSTLEHLLALVDSSTMALLTVDLDNPTGYGRIIRDEEGCVTAIVEQKDASDDQLTIAETNTGVMALKGRDLKRWLAQLENDNAQGEFYLTDVIALAVADGYIVATAQPEDFTEVSGVNNKQQLAVLERVYQKRVTDSLMAQGVGFLDPSRFDLRGSISSIGQDVIFDVNVVLEGELSLGSDIRIGPNCYLKNVTINDGVTIEANSIIEDAHIGRANVIGPFARIRPGTHLSENVKVGNFVEIKKTTVGQGSKINHLSYVGDSIVGADVNIGAGTITCNYDGANKFQTTIKDGAFIGSDTQLVAPVVIGERATIGAGSTITRDAPDNALTLTRGKQQSIAAWKRPQKES